AGLDKDCYKVISVIAPEELRLERIMSRDGISRGRALQRINAQYGEEYYTEHSDCVIVNDGKADIKAQLGGIIEEIL
ncbi:MAG: dephospho-CoA kinase, partial [Eubacterium sp.]|nr:dephospho-CoA kinase [Eubacterium sp.]